MRAATTAETGSLIHYARRTSVNRFGWLEWVVKVNLPLLFCENPLARRYTSLEPISVEILRTLMESVAQLVGSDIAAELPDRFGFMLNGWSHRCTTSQYSYAMRSTESRTTFGKALSDCVYLVGDNCSVNKRLVTIIQVPLFGFASHRLNLAVRHHLEEYDEDLAIVQALMLKLRTLKQSAKLRLKTPLRQGSTFAMVHRYRELIKVLNANDDDIMELLPSPACNLRPKTLFAELKTSTMYRKSYKPAILLSSMCECGLTG
ncbi:hypothetical protein PR001_g9461 [Phytophthora rubi]|uniref:Uncharacterized protein n=1 Tax=Phytophthora rubi TaxID=129364 RepID=A0A6A3N153_9STRA|nr:hypothetical protein PR001_g9461 [Phytophthora rubi]